MGYFIEYYDGSAFETAKGIVGVCMSIVLLYLIREELHSNSDAVR